MSVVAGINKYRTLVHIFTLICVWVLVYIFTKNKYIYILYPKCILNFGKYIYLYMCKKKKKDRD